MTRKEFFQNTTSQGILPTLQLMAAQNPVAKLQTKRLESLSKDLKLGLVTLANAAIQRNRIAAGILSLLERDGTDENGEDEAQSMLSEILREHLKVSETEESASKALARAELEEIERNRQRVVWELKGLDLSPVPKTALGSLDDIRKMIASSQLELALQHTLTLTGRTEFFKKTEHLAERYKQLTMQRKLHVISFEEAEGEENRIAEALVQLLESFGQANGRNKNSFWRGIRKWLYN